MLLLLYVHRLTYLQILNITYLTGKRQNFGLPNFAKTCILFWVCRGWSHFGDILRFLMSII